MHTNMTGGPTDRPQHKNAPSGVSGGSDVAHDEPMDEFEDEAFGWFSQGFIKALSVVQAARESGTLDELMAEVEDDIAVYRSIFEGEDENGE